MGLHALALRPDDFAALGEADRQSRARAADRQADAAELSPEPTVEIEKSEVQPRRRRNGHLRHRRRRLMLQLGLPARVPLRKQRGTRKLKILGRYRFEVP